MTYHLLLPSEGVFCEIQNSMDILGLAVYQRSITACASPTTQAVTQFAPIKYGYPNDNSNINTDSGSVSGNCVRANHFNGW